MIICIMNHVLRGDERESGVNGLTPAVSIQMEPSNIIYCNMLTFDFIRRLVEKNSNS